MPFEDNYFLIGNPFIYEEDLVEPGFTPLELIPLNLPSKFLVDAIFKFSFDVFEEVKELHRLKIFPRNPYALSYQVDHELSSSILEEAFGLSSRMSEILQVLNLGEAVDAFTKALVSALSGIRLVGTFAEVARRRWLGYVGSFPKVWRGTSMDYGIRIEASHSIYSYQDPAEEYKNLLSLVGKYVFPRSGTKEEKQSTINAPEQGQATEGTKKVEEDNQSYLYNLMYKYPYFVKVLNAKTKGIIIHTGMITHCTIETSSDKFLWSGIPSEVSIQMHISPIFPMILNIMEETQKNKFYDVDVWAEELSKTVKVENPFQKSLEQLDSQGAKKKEKGGAGGFNFFVPSGRPLITL